MKEKSIITSQEKKVKNRKCKIINCNGIIKKGNCHVLNKKCIDFCIEQGRLERSSCKKIMVCDCHFEDHPGIRLKNNNMFFYLKKQFDANGFNLVGGRDSSRAVIQKKNFVVQQRLENNRTIRLQRSFDLTQKIRMKRKAVLEKSFRLRRFSPRFSSPIQSLTLRLLQI